MAKPKTLIVDDGKHGFLPGVPTLAKLAGKVGGYLEARKFKKQVKAFNKGMPSDTEVMQVMNREMRKVWAREMKKPFEKRKFKWAWQVYAAYTKNQDRSGSYKPVGAGK